MRWLALLFPPLVVLSAAHELYLRNQQELDHTLGVLQPFWVAAAVAVLAAGAVRALGRGPRARAALWAYHAGGVAFLLWGFLRALPLADHLVLWTLDTAGGAVAFAVLVAAAWLLASRHPLRSFEPFLAVLAVVLAAREAHAFATRLETRPPPPPRDVAAELGGHRGDDRPNVYHLILDGFQDELFETPPGDAGDALLQGFVRFAAASPGRATSVSLPVIFTGRDLPGMGQRERLREALVGPGSLLVALRRAGYRTVGFVPRYLYAEHPDALDVAVYHEDNARLPDLRALHRSLFARLFVWRALPLAAVRGLAGRGLLGLDPDFVRSAQALRLSTDAQPLVSRLSLESVLESEPALPARGRYTLVHLLLPHGPYLLRSDCGYAAGAPPTDLGQQTACTLRLVGRFLSLLERLGRLDGAVVVIHGDHGSGETRRDGRLVPDEGAYLRTLLLVKPAGARGPLRPSAEPARLADVAPSLLALLGASGERTFDGRTLLELSGGSGGPP